MRHEVPVGAAATLVAEDSNVTALKHLEALNELHCAVLTNAGYDGSLLRNVAPTRETYVAVTHVPILLSVSMQSRRPRQQVKCSMPQEEDTSTAMNFSKPKN